MSISVQKSPKLRKTVILPASKSISNRALIINALSGAGVTPQNLSDCDDTMVMIRALDVLDQTSKAADSVHPTIDIMAAGTAMRFLTAYLSVTEGERTITGTERMRHRPISILVDALRELGADIEYTENEGFPPLHIRGKKLKGGSISLPGNVSSQYISAMLMIGPVLENGLTLTLTEGIASRPYIDMTLSIMRQFGAEATWKGENTIYVAPKAYKAIPYYIENDWSASSYWFEMVALTEGSEVHLPGLFEDSLQGDQTVKDIFEKLGVTASYTKQADNGETGTDGVTLRHSDNKVERLDIDMLHCPDLAQTIVVTCCMMNVNFRITGLQSLKIKETDRIFALRTELKKLGYVVSEEKDSILYWNGERCEPTWETDNTGKKHLAAIDTYEDHRMAMSFAPCCQVLDEIHINHPEVVSKSYPTFWKEFEVKNNE